MSTKSCSKPGDTKGWKRDALLTKEILFLHYPHLVIGIVNMFYTDLTGPVTWQNEKNRREICFVRYSGK